MPISKKTLLICATPRSGSSYFCSLLRQSNAAGWPGEWLGEANETHLKRLHDLDLNISTKDYADALYEDRKSENGVFSLKAMPFQLFPFLKKAKAEIPDGEKLSNAEVLESLFGEIHYFHVYRENTISQAISLYIARKTKIWREYESAECFVHPPCHYDFESIRAQDQSVQQANKRWERFFEENSIPVSKYKYEEFSQIPQKELVEKIFDSCEIEAPPFEPKEQLTPKRQKSSRKNDWKQAYLQDLEDRENFEQSDSNRQFDDCDYQINLVPESTYKSVPLGSIATLKIHLHNQTETTWIPGGDSEGEKCPFFSVSVSRQGEKIHTFEKPLDHRIPAKGSSHEFFEIETDSKPGNYEVQIKLKRRGQVDTDISDRPETSVYLQIEETNPEIQASEYFQSSGSAKHLETPLGNLQVDWFPWCRHPKLEWMYFCAPHSSHGHWLFLPDLGFVWTSDSDFPGLWSPDLNEWLIFKETDRDFKIFERESDSKLIRISLSGMDLPVKLNPRIPQLQNGEQSKTS